MIVFGILGGVASFLAICGVGVRLIIVGYRVATAIDATVATQNTLTDTVAEFTGLLAAHLEAHDRMPPYATQETLRKLSEKVDRLQSDVRTLYAWRTGVSPVPTQPQGAVNNGNLQVGDSYPGS